MENKDKVIQELFTRLEQLSRQQKGFQEEIHKLQQQLQRLKSGEPAPILSKPSPVETVNPAVKTETFPASQAAPISSKDVSSPVTKKTKRRWEEFIGTNLLNKVGIAVLVVGIAFGVKYSIDRELLNDLTRTILGYIAGMT